MARRRQEIALQTELETQEEWNEAINKEGLTVVDVYQQWAGPCKSVEANFKRIKFETGESLLKFALVIIISYCIFMSTIYGYVGTHLIFLYFHHSYQNMIYLSTLFALLFVLVIDIYQTYGGPCKALEAKFRAIKNTLGDPLLNFAVAKADTIDSLEKYRGRCEPCFLFYASGVLVDAVMGANAPELQRKIMFNLEQEKKILKEGGERIEHRFERAPTVDDEDEPGASRNRSPSIVNAIASQQYTLAVIRPSAYADGKTDEIVDKITQQGFKILLQQERHLNDNDIRQLHRHKMNDEGYEDHISRMTSGPCIALLLQKTETKDASVDDFREFVNSDELLKENIDCTQSIDNVQSELMLLFPNVAQKPHSAHEKPLERTLAIIRPSALKVFKDAIIQRIQDSGFDVTRTREIQLTKEQAEEFYAEKKNEPYYHDLIHEMTAGPALALYLVKKDAVRGFRTLLGPAEKDQIKDASGTFRHDFDIADVKINSLHAPKTRAEATRNLKFFFPEEHIFVILKPNLTDQQRSEIVETFKKAGFFILARKVEKLTHEQVAKLQHAHHGKDYYEDLVNYMTSGSSELLALVKENASTSWQEVVGPEDPAKASETAPNSLRAMYGKDLVHNAIDVSSDTQQVQHDIHLIFGDLDREEQD